VSIETVQSIGLLLIWFGLAARFSP